MKPLKDQAHAIWLHLIIFSFIFHGASHSVSGPIPLGMSINSHYLLFSGFIVLTGPKHLNTNTTGKLVRNSSGKQWQSAAVEATGMSILT